MIGENNLIFQPQCFGQLIQRVEIAVPSSRQNEAERQIFFPLQQVKSVDQPFDIFTDAKPADIEDIIAADAVFFFQKVSGLFVRQRAVDRFRRFVNHFDALFGIVKDAQDIPFGTLGNGDDAVAPLHHRRHFRKIFF